MKLKDLTREELETMSYVELTELILTENKEKMKIVDIFKKICTILELSEAAFENKIADFFELISTDKNFVVLEKGYCDLRKKHSFKLVVEDDEEETSDQDITEEDLEETNEEEEDQDIFYDNSSDEDDVSDVEDELSDFVMVDEEETSM